MIRALVLLVAFLAYGAVQSAIGAPQHVRWISAGVFGAVVGWYWDRLRWPFRRRRRRGIPPRPDGLDGFDVTKL